MRKFFLRVKAALHEHSMRAGEVPGQKELAMIEIKKEEKEEEVEQGILTEKDVEEEEEEDDEERIDERLVEMKLSKEREEDSLNNNSEEKDDLIFKLKSENPKNYGLEGEEAEEEEEEEVGMKEFQLKGLQGMSPVETATLLLISRIALFNKVKLMLHCRYQCTNGQRVTSGRVA